MPYNPGDIASKAGETALGAARKARRKVFEEAGKRGVNWWNLPLPGQLAALARGQTTDSEFRNFVEDRIDRAVNVIRFRRTTGSHFGDNVELRLGRETCFQCVPPGKFRPRAMHFNE